MKCQREATGDERLHGDTPCSHWNRREQGRWVITYNTRNYFRLKKWRWQEKSRGRQCFQFLPHPAWACNQPCMSCMTVWEQEKKEIMQRRVFAGKTVLQKQWQSAYRKPQCVRAWGLMSLDDGGNAWCQLLTHTCTPTGIPTIPRVPQWNSTEAEEERSITEGGRKQTTNTDTRTVKDSSTEGRAAGS